MSVLLYGCTTWTWTKHMEEKLGRTTQRSCELFWTNPGSSRLQNRSRCPTIYFLSHKSSKLDEEDILSTAGEIKEKS